jgi:hypothetical protein
MRSATRIEDWREPAGLARALAGTGGAGGQA